MDEDEREELCVLTQTWSDAARRALVAAYERRRALGDPHEVALMLALGELLP